MDMFLNSRKGISKAKQARINKRLTHWLGGSTAVDAVDDLEFRAFVEELCKDAKVPGKHKLMKDIQML